MNLKEELLQNDSFQFSANIFYQADLPRNLSFEKKYLDLRKKENRIYSDTVLRSLPSVDNNHFLKSEWKSREISSRKLISYLRKANHRPRLILEIGCGNGWLSHQLSTIPHSQVLGIDINEFELLQAGRVFGAENLCFAYADISTTVHLPFFDIIILSSSLQYFENAKGLIIRLLNMLNVGGEIHVIDTPIYDSKMVNEAKLRSRKYFLGQDSTMGSSYFHHDWNLFNDFNSTTLYDPKSFLYKLLRKVSPNSPFPWVRITK